MNNRFSPPRLHPVHASPYGYQPLAPAQSSPYGYQSIAASHASPYGFPTVGAPKQGDLGYSAPKKYRSSYLYPIQEVSPCCPTPTQAYPPFGPYLQGHPGHSSSRSLHSAIESDVREHTPNFVRKDSYWSSLPAVSYTGVRQQVARKFVDFRFAHRKSQRVGFKRPFMMSSSTALLPKDRKKQGDDHPIFLRVCHSPWIAIGQKALIILRGITALYLLVSFILIMLYEVKTNKHGWLTAFEFSNIVYFLQVLYTWIALLWTWMHLHYPHHGNQIPTGTTRLQNLLSPPRQNPTTKNRSFFSVFYTAAVTYPHIVTFIYWAILIPKHETTIPVDKIFTQGWYTTFFVLNKNAINSLIALIEVFIFSSIRRQDPLGAHVLGLTILSLLYVGWAYAGHCITGKYAYYFFDHDKLGWHKVAIAIVGFVVLTNIWLAFVYGLTGIREKLTKRSENKSYGYARLPQ